MEVLAETAMEQPIDSAPDMVEEEDSTQRHSGIGIIQIMGVGLLAFTLLMGVMGILMVSL